MEWIENYRRVIIISSCLPLKLTGLQMYFHLRTDFSTLYKMSLIKTNRKLNLQRVYLKCVF